LTSHKHDDGRTDATRRGRWRVGDPGRTRTEDPEGPGAAHSVDPQQVWALLERGEARLLDLRTEFERRRYGAPPGAVPVSVTRHVLKPEGEGAIYLCQHAVRSKATLRNGAAEVAGGFAAWRRAGLPIENVD
jgi:rhodanese-related sulfurtransferase